MKKQPFSYYGGKQKLASKIIPYIPKHNIYVEPFCGGASVFWRKPCCKTTNNVDYREVLNDKDGRIVHFFRVLQDRDKAKELQYKLEYTLYSREEHKKAAQILKNGEDYNEIEKAWAWWIQSNWSYSNQISAGWGFGKEGNNFPLVNYDVELSHFTNRLREVHIESKDALDCIKTWDHKDAFFYIDPPYIGTHCGHYKGYTEENFQELIETLKECKGSFILSHYFRDDLPSEWKRVDFKTTCKAAGGKYIEKEKHSRIDSIWIVDKKTDKQQLSFFN